MKKMFQIIMALAVAATLVPASYAGGVKYKNDDGDYVKFGGRIQLQYHHEDDDGDDMDELRFRRIRPYIEGSVHEDWKGKFQWDMGKGKVELKDAYFEYKGFDVAKIRFGNNNFPFSRELLTSSKKQQLVERTFVGDHDYGTPDRQAGIHLLGEIGEESVIEWGLSACKGAHDPDETKLDFDTAISLNKGDDWSEGNMFGGRVELHPMGLLKKSQGDFKRDKVQASIGVAAFTWANDNDNLNPKSEEHTKKFDLDTATGYEISGAVRGYGFSVDAEFNSFQAELVDAGVTSGIYEDSETTLNNYALEAGYMVLPGQLEVVGGYQSQDADGYSDPWNRASVGLNYFVKKHDIKYQVTYRSGENKNGKDGHDVDEVFVQAQYVF